MALKNGYLAKISPKKVIVIFNEGLNEGAIEGIKFELFIMISATFGGRICCNIFYDSWDTVPRIFPSNLRIFDPGWGRTSSHIIFISIDM